MRTAFGRARIVWLLALLTGPAQAQLRFDDDGEHGFDAGPWGYSNVQPNVVQSFTPLAAHRGDGGYRLLDNYSTGGNGSQGGIGIASLPRDATIWLREWVRISPTSINGNAVFTGIAGQDLRVTAPGGELQLAGSAGGQFSLFTTTVRLDGGWHLMELYVEGIGTDAGTRALWFDGVRVARVGSLDFTGLGSNLLQIGEWWSDDRRWTGSLDFDDVRLSVEAPASRLAVREVGRIPGCVQVSVGLEASSTPGTFVPPVRDVLALATVDGGTLHPPSSGCLGAGTVDGVILLRAGTVPDASFFVRADAPGDLELVVEEPDYLPAREVFSGLVPPDGGVKDSGVGDGGTGPRRYTVGCGCQGASPGLSLWGLLLLARRTRRRGAHR